MTSFYGTSTSNNDVTLRRSQRILRTPSHIQDYICNSASVHDCDHTIANLCLVDPLSTTSHTSSNCVTFSLSAKVTPLESAFYHQAKGIPKWEETM